MLKRLTRKRPISSSDKKVYAYEINCEEPFGCDWLCQNICEPQNPGYECQTQCQVSCHIGC